MTEGQNASETKYMILQTCEAGKMNGPVQLRGFYVNAGSIILAG